jgi:hypothetical protein
MSRRQILSINSMKNCAKNSSKNSNATPFLHRRLLFFLNANFEREEKHNRKIHLHTTCFNARYDRKKTIWQQTARFWHRPQKHLSIEAQDTSQNAISMLSAFVRLCTQIARRQAAKVNRLFEPRAMRRAYLLYYFNFSSILFTL